MALGYLWLQTKWCPIPNHLSPPHDWDLCLKLAGVTNREISCLGVIRKEFTQQAWWLTPCMSPREPWLTLSQPMRICLSEYSLYHQWIDDFVVYTWSNRHCCTILLGLLCTNIKLDDVNLFSLLESTRMLGSWVFWSWPVVNKMCICDQLSHHWA